MNNEEFIAALCRIFRANSSDILKLIKKSPYQYKHYTIQKRTGGVRDIYHPSANLKVIQRWLISNLLNNLPVHESVYSYVSGRCIRSHAELHVHSNYLIRLDFKDFFPSIDHDWLAIFFLKQIKNKTLPIDRDLLENILKIVCRYDQKNGGLALSIGAPTSPLISNAIFYDADVEISELCAKQNCIYSRYADDIYLSSKEKDVLAGVRNNVYDICFRLTPKLKFNTKKEINVSKKMKRMVTGLVITPDRKLSIGRQLKRSIKTKIFLYKQGRLEEDDFRHLCGIVSYIHDVEPVFFQRLQNKFGNDCMDILYRTKSENNAIKKSGFGDFS